MTTENEEPVASNPAIDKLLADSSDVENLTSLEDVENEKLPAGKGMIIVMLGMNTFVALVDNRELVKAGEYIELREVWKLHELLQPMQSGGLTASTLLMPMHGSSGPIDSLRMKPDLFYFPEGAHASHLIRLVQGVLEAAQEHRAKETGISLVKPGAAPRLPPPPRKK